MTPADGVVLVVDDEEAAREGMRLALEPLGLEVVTVASASDALRVLAERDVALVLTDMRMPGMDGFGLLERIKASWPEVEVVMITGYASIDGAIDAMKKGAFHYVSKPFKLEEVRQIVLRAVERSRLNRENSSLRRLVEEKGAAARALDELVCESKAMRRLRGMVSKVAQSDSTVLITGESGVGKELVAHVIHAASRRSAGPFVAVNCAAIPAGLIESELFGYEKGAFTDARRARPGLFEAASGGAIFMDEIGELALDMQAKLLRVIQEREVMRIGSRRPRKVDFRLLAATNRDLEKAVREGRFRGDLYYRLNVIRLEVPPLRERREDILPLAERFLAMCCRREGKRIRGFTAGARRVLLAYEWPGNVRELQNVVERAVILADSGEWIDVTLLGISGPAEPSREPEGFVTLDELERRYIFEVLEYTGGNKSQAARILGVDRSSLWRKLKSYGSVGAGGGSDRTPGDDDSPCGDAT